MHTQNLALYTPLTIVFYIPYLEIASHALFPDAELRLCNTWDKLTYAIRGDVVFNIFVAC